MDVLQLIEKLSKIKDKSLKVKFHEIELEKLSGYEGSLFIGIDKVEEIRHDGEDFVSIS